VMIDWYLVVNQERETDCEACVLATWQRKPVE
jgi:hypothetical protein